MSHGVGWRHEKEEEVEEKRRGGVAADRKRARRLIRQFSYITAPPPPAPLPYLPPCCQTCRQMKPETAAASQRSTWRSQNTHSKSETETSCTSNNTNRKPQWLNRLLFCAGQREKQTWRRFLYVTYSVSSSANFPPLLTNTK